MAHRIVQHSPMLRPDGKPHRRSTGHAKSAVNRGNQAAGTQRQALAASVAAFATTLVA